MPHSKDKNCKLTVKKLCLLVRYKQTKEDAAILPSTKTDLLARWNETKHHSFPCSSPNNSDDKEEEDANDKEGNSIVIKEIGTTGFIFEHDESEDESDD